MFKLSDIENFDYEIFRMKQALIHGKSFESIVQSLATPFSMYYMSTLRQNILSWYPFKKKAKLLELGSKCGVLTDLFVQKVDCVYNVEKNELLDSINSLRKLKNEKITSTLKLLSANFFDYIIAVDYFCEEEPISFRLAEIEKILKKDGELIIGCENRLGMKYFAGAKSMNYNKAFYGVEGKLSDRELSVLTKQEWEQVLVKHGLYISKIYYPFPDHRFPESIYSNQRLPKPGELIHNIDQLYGNQAYTFNYGDALNSILNNHAFQLYSNSFIIVAKKIAKTEGSDNVG